jgi:hypothetical protein
VIVHDFSAGGVLARSFTILSRNFVPFVLLTAIVQSPLFFYTYWVLDHGYYEQGSTYNWVVLAGQFLLGTLVQGMVTFGVFQELRGTPASIGRCLAVGAKRLVPVLSVAVLVAIIVAAGFFFFLIPGLILTTVYWVSVPAAVVENAGVGEAMNRSRDLTRGYRWSIFGVIFLIGLMGWLAQLLLGLLLTRAGGFSGLATFFYGARVIAIPFGALSAVAGAVAYHDLRVTKEGVGTDDLAKVFD